MRRWLALALAAALIFAFGSFLTTTPLSAQGDDVEATIAAYQTRVAALQTQVAKSTGAPSASKEQPQAVASPASSHSSAAVKVAPTAGPLGTAITLTATGFAPGEQVDQFWGSATSPGASGKADANGTAVIKRKVPNVPAGQVSLRVVGKTSGRTASVTFTVSPPPPTGTRENPVPVGTSHDIGTDWTITVKSVTPDALGDIQAENQFNEPPAAGNQFFMVTIAATYHGAKQSDKVPFSLSFNAVGTSGVSYQSFSPGCGVIPNEMPTSDVFQGATVEGNVCWSVKSSDASSLVMYVEPLMSLSEQRVFFSIQP